MKLFVAQSVLDYEGSTIILYNIYMQNVGFTDHLGEVFLETGKLHALDPSGDTALIWKT